MPRKPRTSSPRLPALQKPARYRRRLFFEPLEERRLLAIDAALIKDINNGGDSFPDRFAQYGGYVYFRADDGVTGLELWRTDGSTANLLTDLHPSSGSDPNSFTVANGKLFFTATSPTTNREVWVTDGVSVPQVFDVRPGNTTTAPANLTSFNGELYFVENGGTGIGIWHTNGIAFPTLVPGTAGLNPSEMIVAGGKLYFVATPAAAPSNSRVYSYDGSTLQALDISGGGSYGPKSLIDLGGTVYFSGSRSSPASGEELFKVTGATTVSLVMDISSGTPDSSPSKFTVAGTNLFFKANNGTATNLWKTSSGGTQKVTDPIGVTVPSTSSFASIGSLLYFVGTSASGTGIFTSDGTTITSLPLTIGMNADQLTNVGGQLYFVGTKAGIGRELWYLNVSTPTLVKDIVSGSGSSFPDGMTAIGSNIYFNADDGLNGRELWIANDFAASAPQTINQDASGNLVITDNINGNDDITIQSNGAGGWTIIGVGANFGILGTVPAGITASSNMISVPASAGPSFGRLIFNTGGGSDKLTVKLDNLAKRVDFDGGESTSDNDRLVVQSIASYSSETTTLTSTGGGELDFGSDGSIEIHFANLEPVDTTGVAIANKIINLPAGSTATLRDYLSPTDGFMQLAFNGTGPEDEQFQNPSTSLTINATGGGTNLIQFQTPDSSFAPVSLNFTGSIAANDTFRVAAGFPGVLPNASNVVMTSATLDLNNQNETIGSLTGSGALSPGSGILTTGNSTSTSYSGPISGSGGLVKQGVGTFTLSGANTYTGTTIVNAGSLLVDGSLVDGAAAVDVTAQTAGTLGGIGSIAGNVSIASGGKLDAGVASAGGTLALNNGLALASGSTFAVQIGSNTPGDGIAFHDQVAVQGSVALGNAALNSSLINSFTPAGADRFVLIANDGNDPVSGTFSGFPEGSNITVSGVDMYITYAGDSANPAISGNDVILSIQPVINGTSGPDTVTVTPTGGGNIQVTYTLNGVGPTTFTTTTPPTSFTFHGGGGDDNFIVNLTGNSNPLPLLYFDGEGQDLTSAIPSSLGDVVAVNGTGAETATYLSDPIIARAGQITVAGVGVLNFMGTEPANMFGLAVANVNFANGNDVITLTNGFGATAPTAATPAVVISGTSGGVAFEQVHLSGNTTVNLSTVTGGSDGNDTITVTSADNAHANVNFNISTGAGTDTVTVNGIFAVTGSLSILSQNISFAGGTLTAGGGSTVTLNSGTGAISTTGSGTDVAGQDLLVTATTGIDLDTSVLNITATNSGTGSVNIDETNGANLVNVTASTGAVTVTTTSGSLAVTTVTASTTATLVANAGAIIDANGPANNITAASLALSAAAGIGSADALETAVSNLAVLNTTSGNIAVANSVGGLLTLTNIAPVTAGFAVRNTAGGGTAAISNASPLTVAASVAAAGAVLLTAGESAADDVDNLTVNAGVIVQSTGASVTLNSGDNTGVSSTSNILAATTVAINVDNDDADSIGPNAGETLSIAAGAVITAPGGATFNGGAQADVFNFAPQAGAAIVTNGSTPVASPGDSLNLDLLGATGTALAIDGTNDGTFTFTNRASVEYNSIEDVNAPNGCYDLVLNMTAFGPNLTVRRSAPAVGNKLEIVNNAGPTVVLSADLADIAELKVNGTPAADTLTVDDVNGMVSFDPLCIPSTTFPDNPNSAGVARFYFDGAGGANVLNFKLTETGTAQTYAIGNGAAPGTGEGEVLTTNTAGRNLVAYFSSLGHAGSVNRTGVGAAAGALTVLGDAAANTLTVTAAAGLTTVNPATFAPFTFVPGGNYSQLSLQAAGGNDAYNINGAGGAGLDNLAIPAIVADSSGTDTLFVNDSTDATGDSATITQTGIDGLNPLTGSEITYSGIETLDVTGTSAGDTLTTSLGGPVASPTSFNGLVNVNVRGNGGVDNMFLHVADSLTNASLDFVNLFGDADGDNFGGAAAADHIRPVLASGQTQIIINGDANAKTTGPVNPGTDPVLTSPDHLFADVTTTNSGVVTLPVVIVDTNGGYADTANTVSFRYNGIEDIDLYDNGVLTNTAIGDFYLRATDQADYIQFTSASQINPIFRIRVGNLYYPTNGGNYGPYTTGTSKVFVFGRGGNDTINMYNTRLNAAFFGEAGDDILTGGYGDDLLVGGTGNDRINGGAVGGNDEIWGDDFNPATDNPAVASQTGTGNDQINTYGGADTVYGQGGNDIILTGDGADYINGGPGDDQLDGQAGNDRIYGGIGNDTSTGSDGNDVVAGNDGTDTIYGRQGNDILIGGLGQDIVNGNEGGDALVGDESNGSGSGSLAKGDAADAALLALLLAWGPTPTLGSLSGFNSDGTDGSVDTLSGGTEADAFYGFGALLDLAADRNAPGYGPDLN